MRTFADLMSLSGKRAVVTGAAGELGRVISETLAELGADLFVTDIHETLLTEVATSLKSRFGVSVDAFSCDLENEKDRELLGEHIAATGTADILINNAAFVGSAGLPGWSEIFEEQTVDTWRRAIEVNLTSCFHLSKMLKRVLERGDGGVIINIASIYGELGPDWSLYAGTEMANPAAYAASKGGLIQLTRWLSTTMAPKVRVNAISPGGVGRSQPRSFVEKYEARTPLGRMAKEQDFKGAIGFLASDLSEYVTGQILNVNGGFNAW